MLPNAGNHVWTFSTAATADLVAPNVTNVSPPDASTGVCLTKVTTATFSKAMDPASISTTTFVVTDNGVAVAGTVTYDPSSQIASFAPSNAAGYPPGRPLVATVKSGSAGVKDLAGNALAADRVWGFTTGT